MRKLLILFIFFVCTAAHAELPQITLMIAGQKFGAEVAANDPDRMTGLMHRRMLPENRGMLFVFRDIEHHAMWMENTYVALSVAFLDANGVIVNIEDMKPLTRDAHAAVKPAKYALEMNLGWFKKRNIKPGAKVEGLEQAPAAK